MVYCGLEVKSIGLKLWCFDQQSVCSNPSLDHYWTIIPKFHF